MMENEIKARELAALFEKVQIEVGKIFDSSEDGKQRADKLAEKINPALDIYAELKLISAEAIEQILSGLRRCSEIAEREEFISRAAGLIRPVIELRLAHVGEIEKVQQKLFIEEGKFIPLNEILAYGVDQDVIHIHVPPVRELVKDLGIKGTLDLAEDGLRKLALVVKDNKDIKQIIATSWIVAKSPKLLERLGFSLKGKIDEETKAEHFGDEDRPVHEAVMTREELLAKYL